MIGIVVPAVCSAAVFSSSVSISSVSFPPPPNGQPAYEIRTWTQPNNGGDGAFLDLTVSNFVLSAYSYTVGIGEAWDSVTNGTVFSPSTRSSLTPFANSLNPPFTPGQISLSPGYDFYLAFWLQESPVARYGWAHLEYTGSNLILLGNAIEDSGSGIIVGTTTVVPEPSALGLTAVGLVSLFAWRGRILPQSRMQADNERVGQVQNARRGQAWKLDLARL